MKIYFHILFFLLIGFFSYAQGVSGKILGKDSVVISYAEIIATKGNLKRTVISDENGFFKLKVPENGYYLLEVLENGRSVFVNNFNINGDIIKNIRITESNEKIIREVIIGKKIVQQCKSSAKSRHYIV